MLWGGNNEERKGLFLFASGKEKVCPRGKAWTKLYEKRGVKKNWKTE